MITGIGHVAFDVADMEKSLEFYCKGLGLRDAFETRHPETGRPWIRYIQVARGQFIELFYDRKGENSRGSYSHLCLLTDDIWAAEALLKEKGLPVDTPVKKGNDGNWQCWTHDPDGNAIEFMQIMPDSKQGKIDAEL